MKSYLFDAYPILCWLQEEPGHRMVDDFLMRAQEREISLLMNMINLGEVYYRICRITSVKDADDIVAKVRLLPIVFISVSDAMVMEAAKIKGIYPISYADAFATATAVQREATIITADPEFKALSKRVKIVWLE